MATLLIEDVDELLHRQLEASAAAHHRSLSDEARELLRNAVSRETLKGPRENIVDAARRLFGPENGVELDLPARGGRPSRPPPDFSDH